MYENRTASIQKLEVCLICCALWPVKYGNFTHIYCLMVLLMYLTILVI